MRIDSHQHFWVYNDQEFGWIDDSMAAIRRSFLPTDLNPLLDAAGFDASIAVQAPQTIAETDFLLKLAEAPGSRVLGVVGWLDLLSTPSPQGGEGAGGGERLDEQIERYSKHPRFVGVRHIVQAEPPRFLESETFRDGVRNVGLAGLTFDLLIRPHQLEDAVRFVRSLPEVPMVLDHCAKPDIASGAWEPWARPIRDLAACPNLWCKLSGLPFEAGPTDWNADKVRPYYAHVLECFGPGRCMFGSDWPVSLVAGSYDRMVEAVQAVLNDLSVSERALVFGETARAFYLDRHQ